MTTHRATVKVPSKELKEMESILLSGKMDEITRRDGVINTYTAKFDDGREADIKVCNAPTDCGGPWVDAVLFEPDGSEIVAIEPSDSLEGEYDFEVDDDSYKVQVIPG